MKSYKEGLVDNAEMLDRFTGLVAIRKQLIKLSKETVDFQKEHEKLDLARAEMDFYNAVANSENI